nr:TetR/AcrR family transcriptional regulator C-terminal domain-containing protein [Rhodoblastus sphagnicola]
MSRLYNFIFEHHKFRELLRLLVSEADRFPQFVDENYSEFIAPILQSLSKRFDAGIAAGQIEPTDTHELARFVVAPVLSLNIMSLLFGNRRAIDCDTFISTHRKVLLRGLLKPGAKEGEGGQSE